VATQFFISWERKWASWDQWAGNGNGIHEISEEGKMGSISGDSEGYGLHEIDGEKNMDSMRLVGRIYSHALVRRWSSRVLLVKFK